jgi:hypothetical protein
MVHDLRSPKPKSPLTPHFQRGELGEIPLKVPLGKRGI